MRSPAAIACVLSATLMLAAACAAPANPRPGTAAVVPPDTTVIWDYHDVTHGPELLNHGETERVIARNVPRVLREQGISGTVTLELVASREGAVESVSILNASDPQFGAAARAVAVQMRFRPATVRGLPVRCRFTLPVTFALMP
jgi:TonB family protein